MGEIDTNAMIFGNVLLQDALGIFFCFARVDGKRLPEADGVLELSDEDFLLGLARRVVVMIV